MAGRLTPLLFLLFLTSPSTSLKITGSKYNTPDFGHEDMGIHISSGRRPLEYDNHAVHSGEFLLISSPKQHKVVWTNLQNFQSSDHRAFALVDSGLEEPKGLAFDHKRGHLYIADSGAKKIFRYTVLTDTSGSRPTLTTSGVRLTVTEGHPVEWVAIDQHGNLFYAAPDTKNINKIEAEVLHRISKGEYSSSQLEIVNQKELQARVKAQKALKKKEAKNSTNATSEEKLPTDDPPPEACILSVYEASLNPHVSAPAGVTTKGNKLYWTNEVDGMEAGTVVQGSVNPELVEDEEEDNDSEQGTSLTQIKPFKATSLTKVSSGAYSMAVSEKAIFFTRNRTTESTEGNTSGVVSGLLMGSDIILDFVQDLVRPRGLVWDKDQTIYVADQSSGNVWSFPVGRFMTRAPLTMAVEMEDAFGLEILSSSDPCFNKNKVDSDGKLSKTEEIATRTIERDENPFDDNGFLGGFLQNNEREKSSAYRELSVVPLALITALLAIMFQV